MKAQCIAAAVACFTITAVFLPPPGRAADPEVPKEIIAVQIRKQGFECRNPESAKRTADGRTDEPVWILTCEGATYKVQLIPKQAAKVEKLPEKNEQTTAPQQH